MTELHVNEFLVGLVMSIARALVLCGSFILPSWAQAEEAVSLSVVEVADTKEDSSNKKISAETLEKNQAEDLKDAFRTTPEVNVSGGQRAAQKVYVRGLLDTNLNVTIDGARQSGQLFHHQGRLNVEPELLKEIDLQAGTGNALAGPGALGGRLSFVTKDAEDLLREGQSYGALTKARYSTNNDEKGLSLGLFGKPLDSVGVLLYGTVAESIDYRAGGGDPVRYTGAKPKSGLAKVTVRPTEAQRVTLSAVRREDNARRLLRAEFGEGTNNAPNDQMFETETYSIGYHYVPESPWVDLRADLYSTRGYMRQTTTTSQGDASVTSYGANLRNTFKIDDFKLTLGGDWNQDLSESYRATGGQSERGRIFGVYTQASYRILKPWQIRAGARYDKYELESFSNTSLDDDHVSPNVSTEVSITDEASIFGGWSQAFQGPTPIETYMIANAQGVIANSSLKGTIAETTELGARYKQGIYKAEVVAYATLLQHPIDSGIERTGLRRAFRTNTSDVWSRGVNVSTGVQGEIWSGGLALSFNDIEAAPDAGGYKGVGDRVIATVGYKIPDSKLSFGWASVVAMRLQDAPAGQSEAPGYDIHDLTVTYEPIEFLRLGLAVSNIFDTQYVAHGTSYFTNGNFKQLYEPGRDARVSVSYIF